jgi:hypothetical protein
MADLSSTEANLPSPSAPLPSLRRYAVGLGIFLGGIPLCFGAPSLVGIAVACVGALLGIVILPRFAAVWNAWADEAWFEVAGTALMVFGAAGWIYRMVGWTPKPEMLIYPIVLHIGMQIKRRRSKKELKTPRPFIRDR